jgi:hypothetical protein
MSHLDEGQLTLLLDRALDPAEQAEAERHLAACAECRRRYAEVQDLAGEADRLIATVEPEPRLHPTLPARPAAPRRAGWERWRPYAWAATVLLAAGLGWYSSGVRVTDFAVQEVERARATAERPAEPAATSSVPAHPEVADSPAQDTRALNQLAREAGERRALDAGTTQAAPAAAPAARGEEFTAKARVQEEGEQDAPPLAPAPAAPAAGAGLAQVPQPQSIVPRDEVTSHRADRVAEEQAPSPATAARTAATPRGVAEGEFRASSLDEAVKVLGGAVRLVDGITPAGVRIGPPRLVPGADPSAPVVRIVYHDPPGRELWLDQQRVRTPEPVPDLTAEARGGVDLLPGDTVVGSAPAGMTRLRWRDSDGFDLRLTGWLPADSLRALARRVR